MRIEEVIGSRIRDVREINEVTQQELGQRLGPLLGKEWPRQAVSAAEKGDRAFTAAELVAIAHALGTTVPRLMTPPVNVRTIELPSGKEIGRTEVTRSALPRASTEKAYADMEESLRGLAQNLQGIIQFGQNGIEHVGLLHEGLVHAAEAIAFRFQQEEEGQE